MYEGSFDEASVWRVRGWAWLPSQPQARQNIEICEGNRVIASFPSDRFRQDLLDAGKGDGYCGFDIITPSEICDGNQHTLHARISGTDFVLPPGHQQVTPVALCDAVSTYPLSTSQALYIELLKRCVTRLLFDELRTAPGREADNAQDRYDGRIWPDEAETMIGIRRLNNIQYCVSEALHNRVAGDLIETGVWRGGATIFMRALLKALGDTQRNVWVADSFAGLPPPNAEKYPDDANDVHWKHAELIVPLERVQSAFKAYGLLDTQVKFLKGLFRDTLYSAPISSLAVIRLDGDMYESTWDALNSLYPRLSSGGYLIVDDYGALAGCRKAVDDYRKQHGISETIYWVDWSGIYWRKN